ncbi:MAG: hypothetical protein WBN68_03620 [Sedimenticolaceae bacterium]
MSLNIRSKLVLSTILPVLLVYAILFWLGVSKARAHLNADGQQWLLEHASTRPRDWRSASRRVGFDAFLPKSCTEQQLIAQIEELSTIRFESAVNAQRTPAPSGMAEWPDALAHATAREVTAAVDLGDIARLFEIADALSANPAAPRADVENMALMARMFDFDGLRALSERLRERSRAQAGA